MSLTLFLGTALPLGAMLVVATRLNIKWWIALLLLAVSYGGQDLAHFAAGEPTYQSSYTANKPADFLALFYEHCYFLMPLCVDAAPAFAQRLLLVAPLLLLCWGCFYIDSSRRSSPFEFLRSRVLRTKFTSPADVADLRSIRAWAMSQCPTEETSTHWWAHKLPAEAKAAFERLAYGPAMNAMFRTLFSEEDFGLLIVDGMNEVYVAGRDGRNSSSDKVFFTRHIDGPYGLVPFGSVFRCIVGMDENTEFTTHFPMDRSCTTAAEGDVIGFDFHREARARACPSTRVPVCAWASRDTT